MNGERRHALMRAAAATMMEGSNPFLNPFLSDQNVTIEECYQLGEDIARAVRVYLSLDKDQRMSLSVADAVHEAVPGPDGELLAQYMADGMKVNAALRKLKALRT